MRIKKTKPQNTDVSPDADSQVVETTEVTVVPEPAPLPVVVDSEPPQKKGFNPAWLAAGLGSLALLGGAAYFLTQSAPEEDTAPPVITRAPDRAGGARRAGTGSTGVTTVTSNSVTVPNVATAPNGARVPVVANSISTTTTVTTSRANAGSRAVPRVTTAPRVASAPATRANPVASATDAPPPMPVVSAANVRPGPGAPPTLAPPMMNARPMMAPLTPEVAAQLKALWNQGAAAKRRGDYDGARRAWRQALRVRPGHPGFAEAIRKLPTRR